MQVSFNSYLPSRKSSHPRQLDMPFFKSWTKGQPFTVLFKYTRILKFKSQLTFAFFTTINLLSRPLRKQNFTVTGSKSHSLWFVIYPFFCVSVFQGSLLVILIWLTAAKSACVKAAFELQSLHVFEKCTKPKSTVQVHFLKTNINLLKEFDKRSKQFPLVIILKIHLTLSLDNVRILLEENWCRSLMI